MRFIGLENKGVASHNFGRPLLVTNASFSRDNQIELPLRRMRVIRKSSFLGRHSIPFQIKWMTLGQIKRSRFASERFGNSFERHGIFSAWRFPRLLLDFV